ncbi:MAG: FkbM family methyltransferase, partial [Paracoccaceae bacterium]
MSNPYFPMGSRRVRRLENSIRKRCVNLPAKRIENIYSVFTALMPPLVNTKFQHEPNAVIVRQQGQDIAFPNPLPLIKYSHVSFGYKEILKRKYTLPGFVEVTAGDVVVDCGAFVGGFSLSACEVASEVHIFEPSIQNVAAIKRNFEGKRHVHVNSCGLFDADKEVMINLSSSAVEHSLLEPDDGTVVSSEKINVRRLDSYFSEHSSQPDFVKIEAEGVEIEVFDGLGDLRPAKIAIDVS